MPTISYWVRTVIDYDSQFFITATGTEQAPIHNLLGKAIVDACLNADQEGRKFRIIIVIPAIPGFAGDLRSDAAAGTRAIMDYQYKSSCRGENSIFGRLRAEGVDPTKYVFVFNLRSYDRINNTPDLKKQEETSGVTYQQLQRAQAEEIMGTGLHAAPGEKQKKRKDVAKKATQPTTLKGLTKRGAEQAAQDSESESDLDGDAGDYPGAKAAARKHKLEERRHNAGTTDLGQDEEKQSSDSIAKNAMLGEKKVSEEVWAGTEPHNLDGYGEDEVANQEKENFIQEQLYIHGKVSARFWSSFRDAER